jgi:hypothetical protein
MEKLETLKVPIDRNSKWATKKIQNAAFMLAVLGAILSTLPPELLSQLEESKLNNLKELARSLEAIANGFYEVPAENCPLLVEKGYNRARTIFFACCEECARDLKMWILYLPERVIFQKGEKWYAVAWGHVVSPKPFDTLDDAIACLREFATEADLELLKEPSDSV